MKLFFINGSPKAKNSASEKLLESLKKLFPDDYLISDYNLRKQQVDIKVIEQIAECNSIVLAFPLYVDGIPSQLLNCLYQMETYFKSNPNPDIKVYTLINCGFYEGSQASLALEMVRNWCQKAGIRWGQGIGIGGGGMLSSVSGTLGGQGPNKDLGIALNSLTKNISASSSDDNIFTSPNIPRFVYKVGGDFGWNQQIKSNGLTKRDLFIRK